MIIKYDTVMLTMLNVGMNNGWENLGGKAEISTAGIKWKRYWELNEFEFVLNRVNEGLRQIDT